MTYLIVCHESPREDAYFLVERDLADRVGQVRSVAVNYVLKVLGKAFVQGIQIHLAVYDSEKAVVLVDSEVFDYSLRLRLNFFLPALWSHHLVDEVRVDLL